MSLTLAFDIYGTLIDTAGVTRSLEKQIGDRAPLFSMRWREKQLEYSFRRSLMAQYREFSICTRDALNYTCESLGEPLPERVKRALLEEYRYLPVFPDVAKALQTLKDGGDRLYAFSNGVPEDLNSLLRHAGINDLFLDIVSVHEIKKFKPAPEVYHHFLQKTESTASESWLISSNSFDILGAMGIGMNTAWVRRTPANVFDPWGGKPTTTIQSLAELPVHLHN